MIIGNVLPMTSAGVAAATAHPERERLLAAQAGLSVRSTEPLNCETPAHLLGEEVTPSARFFRRNHFPIPVLDPDAWRLRIGGLVRQPLSLSLHELTQLPVQTAVITLECAGNGRTLFRPPAEGEQWGLGAVSTAAWTGVRLADVLRRAVIRDGAREVVFRGADGGPVNNSAAPVRFERSLPLADALESGALFAYVMNGQPLPVRHGAPLRLVVPGWYAVASVKWLTGIEVVPQPFDGFFQGSHYVYEWSRGGRTVREPVQRQRVRALITSPAAGQELARDGLVVRGVAWSGTAPIARVEVSVAGGLWRQARLVGTAAPDGWQQWELPVCGLERGGTSIRARAADLAGRVQPDLPEWNRLGYGANFIHEVRVRLR